MGYSPWGCKESERTELLSLNLIKRGNCSKKTIGPNGVTCAKPTMPNGDLIPNLIAVSASRRNMILTRQSGIPWSALGR